MPRQPLRIEVGGKAPKHKPERLNIEVPHPLIEGRVDMYQVTEISYNKRAPRGELVIHWDSGKIETLEAESVSP